MGGGSVCSRSFWGMQSGERMVWFYSAFLPLVVIYSLRIHTELRNAKHCDGLQCTTTAQTMQMELKVLWPQDPALPSKISGAMLHLWAGTPPVSRSQALCSSPFPAIAWLESAQSKADFGLCELQRAPMAQHSHSSASEAAPLGASLCPPASAGILCPFSSLTSVVVNDIQWVKCSAAALQGCPWNLCNEIR